MKTEDITALLNTGVEDLKLPATLKPSRGRGVIIALDEDTGTTVANILAIAYAQSGDTTVKAWNARSDEDISVRLSAARKDAIKAIKPDAGDDLFSAEADPEWPLGPVAAADDGTSEAEESAVAAAPAARGVTAIILLKDHERLGKAGRVRVLSHAKIKTLGLTAGTDHRAATPAEP
jgi:hypothetical protein